MIRNLSSSIGRKSIGRSRLESSKLNNSVAYGQFISSAPFSSKDDSNSTSSTTILGKIMTPENQSYAVIVGGSIGTLAVAKG